MQTTKLFILNVGVDPVKPSHGKESSQQVRQEAISEWTMEGSIAVAADNIHRALEHGLTYLPREISMPDGSKEELQWHIWGCQQNISKLIFLDRDGGPVLVAGEGSKIQH